MSQLLLRIERELGEASDPSRRTELLARKACALTRLGLYDDARALIALLREKHGDWSSGVTHVWIMVAEGLVNWYSDLSAVAMDRLTRAQVLSLAMKYDTVAALSSAWKAHLEFQLSSFDGMFRSLELAIKHAAPENHAARSRIAIAICNVHWLCGRWEDAKRWFSKGRAIALAEGDLTSIEALQYNRAALAVTWLRAEQFLGKLNNESIQSARSEINSAHNFQAIANIQTFTNHLALCEARLCMIEGKFEEALIGLEKSREQGPFASYHFSQTLIDLEVAYCLAKLNRSDPQSRGVAHINMGALIDLDIDDRFVAISLICELRKLDPELGENAFLSAQRLQLRDDYIRSREVLAAALSNFCAEVKDI